MVNKKITLPRSTATDTSNSDNTANFLPSYYRTDTNKKFLHATINQLTQPGTVKKVNGYIGRLNAKASSSTDIFINAQTQVRQNYQLEPGLTITDDIDNTVYLKDYQDYINQLRVNGANVVDHSRLNNQEFYSWDPHIDWDKFANFQDYYWLPNGPDTISISHASTADQSVFTVTIDTVGLDSAYVFTPNGFNRNPTITLYRGKTYEFDIYSTDNVFSFKTIRTEGQLNRYITPTLDNNSITSGKITFTVPYNAPDILFYVSESNIDLGGTISILDINTNGFIDVAFEIIGKQSFQMPNGKLLSNGMCVSFTGEVTPQLYATGKFYVEGVGTAIKLIPERNLEIIAQYTTSEMILFDTMPFDTTPFSDATTFAGKPDYIVINRSSTDKNQWSRYNKWFHKSVIKDSAEINGITATVDQSMRAVRPIIEFDANLKLFNFGTTAITDISLIDQYTTDAFSTIEGTLGHTVDNIQLQHGQRIIFTADTDRLVANNVYRVEFIDVKHTTDGFGVSNSRQIRLVLESRPSENQVVLVQQGTTSQGTMFWYNGNTWVSAQQKTKLNQPPLFDVVDDNAISFGNSTIYPGTTFRGTSVFSYKVGTGIADSTLGFPLSYKNINNIGDINFNFTLLTDMFQYDQSSSTITKTTDVGYLIKTVNDTAIYVNGWQTSSVSNVQPAIRIYRNSEITNNFDIDIFDTLPVLKDISIRVYINGMRSPSSNWIIKTKAISSTVGQVPLLHYQIVFNTPVMLTDCVTIKVYSRTPINANGFYEIPINLQHNPLNGVLTEFTLGEVIDHIDSIIDNIYMGSSFVGTFPGSSNLRDLGNVTQFGTKFVQHSGPLSLPMYHITSANNVINAIDKSRDDYCKFKRAFMVLAETLGVDTHPINHVNLILRTLNADIPATAPYYFSDMVPYGAFSKIDVTVRDPESNIFSLSKVFNLSELSTSSVLIYLNDNQLLHGKDYTFSNQGFVIVTAPLQVADVVSVYEYSTTDGCLIPETPTKLGIWPKYEPTIFLDTTLITPATMIQGHDGSLILAYNDYRDDLILELEKRIYNNIKIKYDPNIFDIHDMIPSYSRTTDYSLDEFNLALSANYYQWSTHVKKDFSIPLSRNTRNNSFVFNYSGHFAPDSRPTPGFWRGIYQWVYDTDRPHLCPWEMLGISEEPMWWSTVYGPAPYTSDNLVMWNDISNGLVKKPDQPIVKKNKFVKSFLMNYLPVDSNGQLVSPLTNNIASGTTSSDVQLDFKFGDVSPTEAAWRRHSHYPFSVIKTLLLLKPAMTMGLTLDRHRIVRNLTNQLIYLDTGVRLRLADIKLPSVYLSSKRVQTAGLINYLVNYIDCNELSLYNTYKTNLSKVTAQLCYRVGAFTSKEKFNLLLESKSPASVGNIFIPPEDYKVIMNTSSPIATLIYSGVTITKVEGGFEVTGYSKTQPYFTYYASYYSGSTITVGGISAVYSVWTPNHYYVAGYIVKYENLYWQTKISHNSTDYFATDHFTQLPSIPIVGGTKIEFRTRWSSDEIIAPYGTKFTSIQEVSDFLLGYGKWLTDQGFVFDEYNEQLGTVTNWETSTKEFIFWTANNWGVPQQLWDDWVPDMLVTFGTIVRYTGNYYRAIRTLQESVFDETSYELINGLSSEGNSVITLSPAATKLTFNTILSVVDDITNPDYMYELFNAQGSPIQPNLVNSYRSGNTVSYTTTDINAYIYCASFYLVQKEHVIVINNATMFNDVVYNPESGYKQDKIKVSGYVSIEWNGSLNVPGFIVDSAIIYEWKIWKDYALGDIVKHQTFYYSASKFLPGTQQFNNLDWIKLTEKPTAKLLPNWNYKATQFTDFYSLDSDNFDAAQQKMAQHLIGYQKRQYLENIIQDDTSEFKFYQGMIIEKGTTNVLNKLFDVLSLDGQESMEFYEEWAIRTGQYGASSAYNTVEFILDEALVRTNPQGVELVTSIQQLDDRIIRQIPSDVYVKPLGYTPYIWPALSSTSSILRSSGHVRADEVSFTIRTPDELTTLDPTLLPINSYVLCTFDNASWDVYQIVSVKSSVVAITQIDETTVLISVNSYINFEVNSYVGIKHKSFNAFYKVVSVSTTSFTINIVGLNIPTDFKTISLVTAKPRRSSSIDDMNYTLAELGTMALLWTDNTAVNDQTWATWKNEPVYKRNTVFNQQLIDNLEFGKSVASTADGNLAAITTALGEVMIYYRLGSSKPWTLRQVINKSFISSVTPNASKIATVVAISKDGKWLATGSPTVSYATVLQTVHGLNIVDVNGEDTEYAEQGVVSIYENTNNMFTLVNTITSPLPKQYEHFGLTLEFSIGATQSLFIGTLSGYGTVYRLQFIETTRAYTLYNPNGSTSSSIQVSTTTDIMPGMHITGTNIDNIVTDVIDNTTIVLNTPLSADPEGNLRFSTLDWNYCNETYTNDEPGSKYGKSIKVSADGTTLVIAAPSGYGDFCSGKVYIYEYHIEVNSYLLLYTLSATSASSHSFMMEHYGQSITVSNNGEYVAVSTQMNTYTVNSDLQWGQTTSIGIVNIYQRYDTDYYMYYEPVPTSGVTTGFGTNIQYSQNTDSTHQMYFDASTTTFDAAELDMINTTTITYTITEFGGIDIYDRYGQYWIFSERLTTISLSEVGYGTSIVATPDSVLVSSPFAETRISEYVNWQTGIVYDYVKPTNQYSWTIKHYPVSKPDVKKIKQAFLYNRSTNKLIKHLDLVDSLQGKNPSIADQEIKFKSFYDPAVYSSQLDNTEWVDDGLVNIDDGISWTTNQVGALWWDLRTAKFIDSYTDDVVYRNSTCSTLAVGASIDIYEWVETDLLPSEWDAEADTEAGLAIGISGNSLYGDKAYSYCQRYNKLTQRLIKTYYFWVKNKITIPSIPGRNLSASTVSNLIANPRGAGYEYLALTGLNSFSLVNVKSLLHHTDVVLSVEYWNGNTVDQNIHSQWKLISTSPRTSIPAAIEQKWFDSLCGKDLGNRVVPDQSLPVKLQYGIENRPRQSMFINQYEALKQLIEQTNLVLRSNLIVDTRNIANLHTYDELPHVTRGLYDDTIDTDLELRFAIAKSYIKPEIVPVITDGAITGISIVSAGRGYLVAPYFTVIGNGTGAIIKSIINVAGQISGCEIIRSGIGYAASTTTLDIRDYSLLVKSDSASNNGWSIYAYQSATETWNKTLSQTYNTTRYWDLIDWYADGYTQFTAITHSINTYADLNLINVNIGEHVKINTTSSNRWVLLKKYADVTSVDWTLSYKVIGSQNGTIQFNSLLYDFKDTVIGYDGLLYDSGVFDNGASIELRIILNSIKDDLLIDDLKSQYLSLFFSSIRYAMSEQTYIDWIFKTSFVNVTHKVGNLHQSVTYRNDNLSNFEEYVSEVTPYRSQIREYVSLYNNIDIGEFTVTDFDMPPMIINSSIKPVVATIGSDDTIILSSGDVDSYPWKSWADTVGFSVVSIKLLDGGSGYVSEPTIKIVGASGIGAHATAFILNGKVNRINLITRGSKYLSIPTILFEGGLRAGGVAANAIVILGNSVVRSNLLAVKFDRVTSTYDAITLSQTETFVGTGSKLQFPLTWVPNVQIGYSSVTVNGISELRDNYTFRSVATNINGTVKYSGSITFVVAPTAGYEINVTYMKDVSMLTAADRIQYFYNTPTGGLGQELSQLMTGIEYAGVILSGKDVNTANGWGSSGYYTDKWDSYKSVVDDYSITVSANVHNIQMPYVPVVGTMLNVYYYPASIADTFNTDGRTLTYTYSNYEQVPTVNLYKTVSTALVTATSSDVIYVTSVYGISVGDTVNDFSNIKWTKLVKATSTSIVNGHYYITVSSIVQLTVGMPVLFLGKEFSNLQDSHTYYIKTISATNLISVSNTVSGPEVVLTEDTGSMTVVVGAFKYDTTVIEINKVTNSVTLSQPVSTIILANTLLKFGRTLSKYQDLATISRTNFTLMKKIPVGMIIEVSGTREAIRLDDADYGSVTDIPKNTNAIMTPYIADGTNNTIIIPANYIDVYGDARTFTVAAGDRFVIRKSTSSGSDELIDIDSAISGGTFAIGSAAGIAADDIIIDGDMLTNQDTHAGPEEVVPGQVIDAVAITVFDTNVSGSYMQFKDMLNRTHFKRLNAFKHTTLTVAALQTNTTITVADASTFDLPNPAGNKPGVIYVNGERIEFFTIAGNVLGQLRRGTLGTSIPVIHPIGTHVQEISTGESMPVSDQITMDQYESDGTNLLTIAISPTKSKDMWKTSIPGAASYGQCNDIEVYIGGYDESTWSSLVLYTVGMIVNHNSYTYKCVEDHTSSSSFSTDLSKWIFFIGNIKLKKSPYSVHNSNINATSPDGDIAFDADFSVDGKSKQIRLTNVLPIGTRVTVIKRTGTDWNLPTTSAVISTFLNAVPGSQYPNN
jgi:hypothetical protein